MVLYFLTDWCYSLNQENTDKRCNKNVKRKLSKMKKKENISCIIIQIINIYFSLILIMKEDSLFLIRFFEFGKIYFRNNILNTWRSELPLGEEMICQNANRSSDEDISIFWPFEFISLPSYREQMQTSCSGTEIRKCCFIKSIKTTWWKSV